MADVDIYSFMPRSKSKVVDEHGIHKVLTEMNEKEWKDIMSELSDVFAKYVDKCLVNDFSINGSLTSHEPVEMHRILSQSNMKQFLADFQRSCLMFLVGDQEYYFGAQHIANQRQVGDVPITTGNFDNFVELLETKVFREKLNALQFHQKLTLNYIIRLISQSSVALPLKMLQSFIAIQDGKNLFDYEVTRNIGPARDFKGGSTQFDFIFNKNGIPQLFSRREALELRSLDDANCEEIVVLSILLKPVQRYSWMIEITSS